MLKLTTTDLRYMKIKYSNDKLRTKHKQRSPKSLKLAVACISLSGVLHFPVIIHYCYPVTWVKVMGGTAGKAETATPHKNSQPAVKTPPLIE